MTENPKKPILSLTSNWNIMKSLVLALFCFIATLSATPLSDNLSSNHGALAIEEGSVGHITFKIGLTSLLNHTGTLLPSFAIGYQTKKSDTPIFQSYLVEFEKAYKNTILEENQEKKEYIYFYPKVYALSYLYSNLTTRIFLGAGGAPCYRIEKYQSSTKDQVSLNSCFCLGLEMGKTNTALSIIKLEYIREEFYLSTYEPHFEDNNYLTLSYIVGF